MGEALVEKGVVLKTAKLPRRRAGVEAYALAGA
jgi:hypothetical protein